VEAGTLKVIGTDRSRILMEVSMLLDDSVLYGRMAGSVNPFGDGRASERIKEAILHYYKIENERPEEFVPHK
jgi:UDP-N-acetylglucosamine 2-epimerase (non-hydrolysing)